MGEGGPKAKVAANLEALRLLKVLEAENRKASPSEQAVLVRYVGWGAFAQDMFQDAKPEWAKERAELKSLLTTEEYDSARASVLNAHYTSPEVIKGMWGAMEYLGFTGGRAIEPASGVGHFIGMTPAALRDKVKWTATELDKVTGAIAQQLYQRADVNVQGFETLNRPNGFYDVAISNVPFGSFNIRDLRYKDEYLIHDYFFIRSLDLVRPGGVVAFITSSGTMDKASDSARAEIMKRADLLGAIRLPGGKKGAFAGNAGTEVTTDILFLRRKGPGLAAIATEWQNLKEIQTPDGPTRVNEYFAARPEMMLGQMRLIGSMYRDKSPVLEGDATNLEGRILDAARQMPANSYIRTEGAPLSEAKVIDKETSGRTKEGAFYLEGDKVMRKVLGLGSEPGLSAVDQDKVRRLVQMRDAVSQLLNVGRDRSKDALVRQRLNSQYDDFVKKYGPINRETVTVTSRLNKAGENIVIRRLPNMAAFRADPDAYKVAAIENYDAEKDTATKAALFSGEVVSDSPAAELKNATDGIGWSLNAFGELNMTAIGDRLGKSKQQVIDELGERVFLNPNGDRWEPAERYLAGDVVEKLDDARAAAEADRAYQRNVAALEAVQPEQLNQEDITVPFGASWVPGSVYEQFLEEVIGTTGKAKVALNPVTKQYSLAGVNFSISAQTQFGTNKVGVAEIISHAFQMKSPRVTETVRTPEGGTKDVVNEEATREAQVKTQLVRKIFEGDIQEGAEGWVWQDADRGELLAKLYNRKFNRLVQQKFDGSHLTFPGLATVITDGSGNVIPFALREHQKASVWRAVQNGNTLLDHVVGAGKTFTMIAAAMEMKRLGQIQRPMFIVPNHMLEQFSREFLQAYPNANILVAQKDEMTRSNRKAFAAKIAAERWDGIVITHDAFGRLPLSKEVYVKFMKDEIAEIEAAIRHMKAMQNKKDPTVKQLESMKKRAETRMKKLIATERKDEGVLFEELGVDQLILDEAHLFKNLQFYTQHTRVKGLAQGASQRAMDMFLKVRELEKTRPGRSAIFATGTPISNTMAEMYTMQRYLQLDELVKLGIDRFDAWAATFGEIRTNMELSPDGRTFRETSSFSRFRNLPELVALYSKMADTKTADMLNLPRPKLMGGKPIIVEAEPSAAEEVYIQGLVKRAEQVRGKKAEKGGDNMLKVVSEGRKVALDYRLIEPEYAEMNPRGKVAMMVERAVAVWRAGNEDQVAKAQLIFCDMGVPFTEQATPVPVPEAEAAIDEELEVDDNADDAEEVDADESEALRSRYNLYEEIRRQLVAKGIPKQQIAFIHEAKDDSKKAALFEKVRRGEVRILLGSTGKMGVGTNVQKRLKAMHHLDAPWKPAEVEQRDGRILRQGNMNPEIEIYRYITKRSFDSFMWQTLERKANFIAQIKAGARGVRIAEDIDSPLPEAAELKAAASGDPRIMQHAELTKEVRDLEARFSSHVRTIGQARRDMAVRQDELAKLEKQLPQVAADAAKVPVTAGDNFKVDLLVGKKGEYTKRAEAGAVMAAFLAEQAALPTKGVFKLTVARFNGLEIVAALNNRLEQPGVTLAVKGYMGRGLEFGLAVDRTPQLDAALMSRMESELADLGVVKGNMEYRIAQIQKELPKIEVAAEDRPFPRMERMKQAKQELSDLTKALGEEKNKKPAGPMIMGNTGTPEQQDRAARAAMPIRKTIETALSGFGYKIVDTGLPFGYTDRWGKLHSFGTQIIDKALPGSDVGKWMDSGWKASPELRSFIKENMTAPWAHRVWFGHDPLANIAGVVEKFGIEVLPDYALQLVKDSMTKAGIPLPGTQWLVHAGLVGDRTATAWLSLNIGEALSGGLSILGTYRLMKQVRNGEPVHRGWAIAGILFKMVGGVLSANPVVLLSAAADVVLLTRATVDGVRRGAAQIEQAAPIKARRGAGPGIYGNLAEAPPFYSALLRTVEGLKMAKAPASQWIATIKNQQGVKAEEIAWLGVEDWLNGQPGAVTKDALAEFIRANQVQVQEVMKGGLPRKEKMTEWDRLAAEQFGDGVRYHDLSQVEQQQIEAQASNDILEGGPTKFATYQLPGGENYREMLLTLPASDNIEEARLTHSEARRAQVDAHRAFRLGVDLYGLDDDRTKKARATWVEATKATDEAQERLSAARNQDFTSSHWSEPNVLAHVRFNERTADGKRTLFIEEIQSDWHQKGRKQGYAQTVYGILNDSGFLVHNFAERWEADKMVESAAKNGKTLRVVPRKVTKGETVPDAPFKTTWPELALKRMVRWAAENGFDQVAWTPGDVQNERYDLSKQIKEIMLEPDMGFDGPRGTYHITATDHSGRKVVDDKKINTPDELADVVGKDVAEKLLSEENQKLLKVGAAVYLRGLDLKVGGQGMKAFYDKMLVDAANKLGKKFGAKVGPQTINAGGKSGKNWIVRDTTDDGEDAVLGAFETRQEAEAFAAEEDGGTTIERNPLGNHTAHTLPITPDMRRAAMQGLPMFETQGKVVPISVTATRAQINAAAKEVDRLTQQMLGRKVKTFTNDVMPSFIPPEFIAAYGEGNRTIYITMRAAHDLANNVGHESLHAMRQLGLINGAEWTAMVAMAKKQGFAPTPRSIELYRREYVGRFGLTEAEFADKLDEESVARLFGNYVATREALTPWARKVIDKLLEWADAVLVAIRAAGVEVKARDAMAKAYRGDLAGREEGRGALALDQLAVAGAAQDVTQTPEFKAWFEDSQVVDAKGNPLVVYHGTNSNITAFSKKRLGSATRARSAKLGFFFADDADVAGSYANRNNPYDLMAEGENGLLLQKLMEWSGGRYEKVNEAILGIFGKSAIPKGQNVLPVFLKIKNPAYMDLSGEDYRDQPLTAFMEKAIAAGHDGVIIREVVDPGPSPANGWAFMPSTHYVVFEPTQIKSVFNGGKFDPSNPAILGNTPDGSGSGGGSVPPAAVAVDAAAQDELAKYAGSINLSRLNTTDDIKRLIAHVAEEAGNFIGERRGKISHEQTVAMAEELGLTEKQLLSRKSGDAWNNAYIFAARTLLIKSGERVLKLAERAGTSNSRTDLAEALRAVQRHLAIQEQMSGLATEAGRALDQFNIMAAKDFGTALDQILRGARTNKSTLAAKMGGEEALAHEMVSMIAQLKDPSKVSEFIGKAYKATFWDMVREFWVSALLSGPKTIIVNLIGNVGVALWQVPTTAVAASIGTVRGGPSRVRMAEINARMSGLVAGSWEGMRLAGQYFMTGESSAPITKLDNQNREAIPGKLGYLVRTPLRAMEAGDQFFKEVNRRAELHALAVRMALEEQRTGAAYDARVAELVDKPSIAMQRQMRDAALYGTFQRDLGPVGRMVMNLREVIPGAWLIIPFIKTGVNLGKFAVEHSPLALASLTLPNSLKSVVAANLRGDNGRVAQDTQIAKIAMGTGMIIGVVSMVAAGVLTGGGPDDWEEKQVWLAAGNQPYSIKIGGTWYSYQRFDPFALLIGVTADFVEASEGMESKQIDEIAATLMHSIANVTTEKSWFKGPADFFDAFFSKTSSKKSMERYVQGMVSSMVVPSLVNQVGQYVDPVWRETNSMAEKIRSRLPYKSQSLMPRRNIFGEELRGEGSFGPDLLSPVWTTTVKDNKLANELLELQYFPSLPNRIVNGHKLTPEQFDRYVELSGKQAVKTLEKRMAGEAWRNFDPDKRIEKIRDAFSDARDEARDALKKEWPALRKKAGSE